jgi:ubiquinone/menaquinone biosynthesis C-methylase UbiE
VSAHEYPVGYGDHVKSLFSRRTAEVQAAFLLPYIRAGMQLLDCGCGFGHLTLDFANLVGDDGRVVGIDVEASPLQGARRATKERGLRNVTFQQANIYELPFDDNAFDVAFSNAVLCHLSDPLKALGELRRVVKPGGTVGCRDMDIGGHIIHPETQIIRKGLDLRQRAIAFLGNNYRIGRELRGLFLESGFRDVLASATCECMGEQDTLDHTCEYLAKQWDLAPFARVVIEQGWATPQEVAELRQAFLDFPRQAGAFDAYVWCQCVGTVP